MVNFDIRKFICVIANNAELIRDQEDINLLVGDALVKQLDGGLQKMKFKSARPLPANALLTEDGVLTYLPTEPENVALVIIGENPCGFKVLKEITIQVAPCLCKNGGQCQRFTNFTLGTGKLCPGGGGYLDCQHTGRCRWKI